MEESAGMAASVEEADDLFDILTQNLVYTVQDGEGAFPDVDELFSQVPLPSEFDISFAEDASTPVSLRNHNGADNSRFAPVSESTSVHLRSRNKSFLKCLTEKYEHQLFCHRLHSLVVRRRMSHRLLQH